jgi:Zn-dependent protease
MMRNALSLGRVFGIELKLDYSWFIIFALVAWSLGGYYFPMTHPGWPTVLYWTMGVTTALLFFASVVAHELAHSFVSQAYGVPVRDITLFIFGGAAQITEEPRSARAEFLMALAGPVTSLVIAAFFGLVWLVSTPVSPPLHALAGWLGWINVALALFNMIPGFPLDGGRVFRAIVWAITGNLRRATQIATSLGRVVAYSFILWGIWQIFGGNWVNGLWIAFIGWFLENAATASYRRVALQELLSGYTAREVMMTDCPHIPRGLTLDALVDEVVLPSGRRCFPVMEGDRVFGLLTLHLIKKVPRERWATTRVEEVMIPRAELKTVKPDDELTVVFDRMTAEDINQYPVMEDERLLGMVARDNVLAFLRTRTELGF